MHLDGCFGAHHIHGPFDDMFQFANIAGPGVAAQALGHAGGQADLGVAGELPEEMVRQRQDVLGPLAERALRQSLIMSSGDWTIFLRRPIAGTLVALGLLLLAVSVCCSSNG